MTWTQWQHDPVKAKRSKKQRRAEWQRYHRENAKSLHEEANVPFDILDDMKCLEQRVSGATAFLYFKV